MTSTYDFVINQGSTFNPTLKYSQPQFAVRPITAVTKSGQAVVTATTHGLTIDWPVWIVGVVGMDQINHRPEDLRNAAKAYLGYFVDANLIRLNVDSSRFNTYTSGGELLYHPPVDLTSFTGRMQIRSDVDSTTVIATLSTSDASMVLGGTAGTITLLLTDAQTALYTFDQAVYDLEIISAGGIVTRLLSGGVTLSKEVTR